MEDIVAVEAMNLKSVDALGQVGFNVLYSHVAIFVIGMASALHLIQPGVHGYNHEPHTMNTNHPTHT